MTKLATSRGRSGNLGKLGTFIEGHFKKGLSKVGGMFTDSRAADDRLFSYFKVFMDDKGVAAVTPSSRFLVGRTIRAMGLGGAKVVIEYGAANGVMTRRILRELPPDGRLLAVELNDRLFASLRRDGLDPRVTFYHGDVREIDVISRKAGFEAADVIVSGIPFAFLSGRGRHELLTKTHALLKPGGRFVAYQVTTHLIPILKEYFRRVKTEFEVRNLPPHFVFTAFK